MGTIDLDVDGSISVFGCVKRRVDVARTKKADVAPSVPQRDVPQLEGFSGAEGVLRACFLPKEIKVHIACRTMKGNVV